jgi:hypothetical protein
MRTTVITVLKDRIVDTAAVEYLEYNLSFENNKRKLFYDWTLDLHNRN